MYKILFVCGRNRWRSPTAEALFSQYPGLECLSAGVNKEAEQVLDSELLAWADCIVVMEKRQQIQIKQRFSAQLRLPRIVCLDIPDRYSYMDPALIELLQRKAVRFLPT